MVYGVQAESWPRACSRWSADAWSAPKEATVRDSAPSTPLAPLKTPKFCTKLSAMPPSWPCARGSRWAQDAWPEIVDRCRPKMNLVSRPRHMPPKRVQSWTLRIGRQVLCGAFKGRDPTDWLSMVWHSAVSRQHAGS